MEAIISRVASIFRCAIIYGRRRRVSAILRSRASDAARLADDNVAHFIYGQPPFTDAKVALLSHYIGYSSLRRARPDASYARAKTGISAMRFIASAREAAYFG